MTPAGWLLVGLAGFVGSIPLGLMMQYGNPEPLLALALPAMYGLPGPNLLAGWALHQLHGVALAVAYVGVVRWRPLRAHARSLAGAVGLAAAYGVATTLVLSVLVMPVWLALVGYPYAPAVPDLAMPEKAWSVLGHALYALPVTLVYALLVGGE